MVLYLMDLKDHKPDQRQFEATKVDQGVIGGWGSVSLLSVSGCLYPADFRVLCECEASIYSVVLGLNKESNLYSPLHS